MKSIHLDLVPGRRWLWCWTNCLVAVGLTAGAAAWPVWKLYRQKAEMVAALDRTKQALRELTEPPRAASDPKHASASKAARLLQADLNPLFTIVEGLQQPGTKLSSLSLDLGSGSARVEYATDSVKSVTEITALLNAGYDAGPWHLESVGAVPAAFASGQIVRAVWIVRFTDLR